MGVILGISREQSYKELPASQKTQKTHKKRPLST
jgi:cell division protein FtsW